MKKSVPTALTLSVIALLICASPVIAGWQIMTSQSISEKGHVSTNLVSINIQEKRLRMDMGSYSSVIVLGDTPGEIKLFHPYKTFERQMKDSNSSLAKQPSESPLLSSVQTNFDGYPAVLYCYSNQPGQKLVWVAPLARFIKSKSGTDNFPGLEASLYLSEHHLPGKLFGTNDVVAGNEYTVVAPLNTPLMLTVQGSTTSVTDEVFTIFSKLISITETNFPSSEFEVPKDYAERDESSQPFKIDPSKFNPAPYARGSLAGPRHQFEPGNLPKLPRGPVFHQSNGIPAK